MAAVLIVLLVVAYFMFFKGDEELPATGSLVAEQVGADGMPIASSDVDLGPGSDLLPFLFQLNSLKLDDSIFSDPVFLSLEDFTVEIAEQPQGRINPFAPLGRESRPTVQTSSRVSAPRLPGAR